jgi:hypothetical protein
MRLFLILMAALCAGAPAWSASPCERELQAGTVCPAATEEARRLLAAFAAHEAGLRVGAHLVPGGAFVIEDVRTGAIVLSQAFVEPDDATPPVDFLGPILPLSTTKLFIAASLWEHAAGPEASALDGRIVEMVAHSDDNEGSRLANQLRAQTGTAGVLADLARYGVPPCRNLAEKDTTFWGDAHVADYLVPARSCTTLDDKTDAETWGSALSIGEANFSTTLLHLTRFMQAIGNNGVMITPSYHEGQSAPVGRARSSGTPIMTPAVSAKMRSVLLTSVQQGSGRGVKDRMRGGWQIGGKTGTTSIHGEPFDGFFWASCSIPRAKRAMRSPFMCSAAAKVVELPQKSRATSSIICWSRESTRLLGGSRRRVRFR